MVIYAASGVGPIVIGALTAALAMILAGCLNIRQAVRAFDRRIYLMIGASLAAAAALEATGGAAVHRRRRGGRGRRLSRPGSRSR